MWETMNSSMWEALNSSMEKNFNLLESTQNLRRILGICKSCIISSPLLTSKDEKEVDGKDSLSGRLKTLEKDYQDIFDPNSEIDPNNEEEFNKYWKKIQSFFVDLGKIFDEMVVPGNKWKDQIVDWFVKEMFKLNDSFYKLNGDIKEKIALSSYLNDWSYDDEYDYIAIARSVFAEMDENMNRDFDVVKESNKYLWIIVYNSLLKLMDEEFKKLLGESDGEKIPTEEEFQELSKNLFIADFLNIKTYEDFCINYDYLKKKQRELFGKKQQVEKYFDENSDLKSEAGFEALHMGKLGRLLRVPRIIKGINFTRHKIGKLFDASHTEKLGRFLGIPRIEKAISDTRHKIGKTLWRKDK